MPKKETLKRKLKWIRTVVACVAIAFLVLVSVGEKHGMNPGLPKLSDLDFILSLFEDNAKDASDEKNTAIDGGLKVHFIDVGQGKAILIEAPEKTVLIDAGENDQGQKLIRYFSNNNINELDVAIGTHPHSDHIGGLDTVISGITVKSVVLPVIPDALVPTTSTYTDLLAAIAAADLKIKPAKPGEAFDLGGGATLTLLGPLKDYQDLNDMSVVSRLDFGDTSFLFTGDATVYAERDMLDTDENLRADVLDVGHHGSSTSTSGKFLQAVTPRIAVISCGLDNMYGHPDREVMQRMMEYSDKIPRTDLDGTIIITSDGETLGIETEK